ncbi:hypothetical protein EDB80DRAFT_139405 [Ilyonectria destructans]|nr:hypothetical protein EDB80DRAFT_139405 [Ilyonectria destructans]
MPAPLPSRSLVKNVATKMKTVNGRQSVLLGLLTHAISPLSIVASPHTPELSAVSGLPHLRFPNSTPGVPKRHSPSSLPQTTPHTAVQRCEPMTLGRPWDSLATSLLALWALDGDGGRGWRRFIHPELLCRPNSGSGLPILSLEYGASLPGNYPDPVVLCETPPVLIFPRCMP